MISGAASGGQLKGTPSAMTEQSASFMGSPRVDGDGGEDNDDTTSSNEAESIPIDVLTEAAATGSWLHMFLFGLSEAAAEAELYDAAAAWDQQAEENKNKVNNATESIQEALEAAGLDEASSALEELLSACSEAGALAGREVGAEGGSLQSMSEVDATSVGVIEAGSDSAVMHAIEQGTLWAR